MPRLFDYIGKRLTGRDDFSAQYHRYRETVQWLAGELLKFDSSLTVKSLVYNVLGGVLKAGALAFLIYYAGLMEGHGDIILLGFSLESRSGFAFYLAMSVALLLLIGGAFAAYAGNRTVNNLSIAFASHCSQRVIASTGKRPADNPHPSLLKYPARVSGSVSGVILMSRSVKRLLQAANPLATLAYSLFVLFYLDARLSLVVMLLALSTLLLQYKVNYQSAQNEKMLLTSRSRGLRKLNRLLANTALTPSVYPAAAAWLKDEYQHSVLGGFLRYFYQRMMAPAKSALVSDLLLAMLSFIVVIFLGRNALLGEISWAHFIGYLLFARICLLSFRGVLVSITGFARYYLRTRQTYEYLRPVSGTVRPEGAAINIVARGKECIGDRKQVKMRPGKPLLIFSPVPLSRFNLYAFIDALNGGSLKKNNILSAATVCISNGVDSVPGGSLNELLAIPATADRQTVHNSLQFVGLAADIERQSFMTRKEWRRLPRKTRANILLQNARENAAPVILVDNAVLISSGFDYASSWMAAQTDSLVGVVSRNRQDLQQYDGKFVVFIAQDRSVSIASTGWCKDNLAVISSWFGDHAANIRADESDDVLFEEE